MNRTIAVILRLSLALTAGAGISPLSATPPMEGTVSVETQGVASQPGLAAAWTETVGKALTEQGMTVLEGAGHGRFVAEVRLSRSEVGTAPVDIKKGKGASVLPGMEATGQGAGGHLSVTLPTSKSKIVPLREVRLEIRIRKRDETDVLWRAEAVTVRAAEARNGGDVAIASDLVTAMFRGYPAQSQDVIGVP